MGAEELTPECKAYIDRIVEHRNKDGLLSMEECQSILEYAAENMSDAVFGIGYYYFAENYWVQNNPEQTMQCLTECTKWFRAAKMHEFLARTYNMLGAVSDWQNNKVVALNYYYIGLQYAEAHRINYVIGMVGINIAYIFMRMKRYTEAAEHYEKSLAAFSEEKPSFSLYRNMATCLLRCGICYLWLGKKEKAYEYQQRVKLLQKEHPGENYPRRALEVFDAECAAARGNREEALIQLRSLLDAFEKEESMDEFSRCLTELAELMLQFEAYDELERLFRKAESLQIVENTGLSLELYPCLSDFLKKTGRVQSFAKYTRQYFAAYEKEQSNNKQVTIRVMELQDRLLSIEKEQEKMRASNRELEALALYDSMTNLANRTLLNEYVSRKFEEAKQAGKLYGVEILDIDYFKQYNDFYGHLEGDRCIEEVAAVLKEAENDRVFCGRYGGDEFVVLYSDMTLEEIEKTVEQIQEKIRRRAIPHEKSACGEIVSVSQGVFVRVPQEENREWDFSAAADTALYHAKRQGRNCYCIETEFHKKGVGV